MAKLPALATGYRWTESVLQRTLTAKGVVDREAVLAEATRHDDGNNYLDACELSAAADALLARARQPTSGAAKGYRWSPVVLARIMGATAIGNADVLIAEALLHENGNKYLDTSELQAAADALARQEAGIISDLDLTVIPRGRGGLPKAAYPGVATLLRELEFRRRSVGGDLSFVTARMADRVTKIPRWNHKQAVPPGPIETGISTLPWEAEREKVRDICAILGAHPNQRFLIFGDSSHRDPEAYRAVVAAYPGRIAAAFIHKVTKTVSPERVEGLHLYTNYADAAAQLLRFGELDEPAARRVMEAAQREGLEITDTEIDQLIADNRS